MSTFKKPWKLFAIQHSHTDVGYTERQEKIQQYHVDYIRQALHIFQEIESGRHPEWKGYKWVCETFWPVESFLAKATEQEKEQFKQAVHSGNIGLSGTYLNFGELISKEVLEAVIRRITDYGNDIRFPVHSAMTADITGFGWGYSQVLADAGIHNLITCIHTHHSMFPLWKKQTPFWWETPNGDRILTWNGEHYMFGNDLGIMPGLGGSYTIKDELDTSKGVTFEMAEIRIKRYIEKLAADGFEFPFAPVMLSGLPTDNGSPNAKMMEFVNEWNEKHGEEICIVPATLDDFFAEVRQYAEQHPNAIPVHRGDWPDWWTDGACSTPRHVQIFREAQRVYHKVKQLDPEHHIVSAERIQKLEYELALFAEHTWGYHSSVSEPWNPFVQELGSRKEAYAANASTLAHTALYDILESRGEALLAPDRPMRFKILNPYDYAQSDVTQLIMENWHYNLIKEGFEVVGEQDGIVYPSQMVLVPRGVIVSVPMLLQPKEERVLKIQPLSELPAKTAFQNDYVGSDRMMDMIPPEVPAMMATSTYLETPYVRIDWEKGQGITSWIDKRTNQNMLRADRNHHAFSPVYDVTKAESIDNKNEVRRKMGRNRKGPDAVISVGTLVSAHVIENGDVFSKVQLTYEVDGCDHYSLLITAYADRTRVDVAVRMHKNSVWDPENLYVSLPFGSAIAADPIEQLWIDKVGVLVRPRIDQLEGSLADYYSVGEGVAYVGNTQGVIIAMPDTPLIQLGSLAYESRLLSGHPKLAEDPAHLYSWTMNNYWETNFAATLGGFYEFRYCVAWGEAYASPERAIEACKSMNNGLLAWRTK